MGKVSSAAAAATATATAAEMNKPKKKKGRPSLLDIQKRNLLLKQQQEEQKALVSSSPNNLNRRSTRRNPSPELGDDDDDERKQKKVKLVVRLPQSNQQQHLDNYLAGSPSSNSGSVSSDSDHEEEKPEEASLKKRKITERSDNADQGGIRKGTDNLHGSPLESGPTTSLPDKKLLVFILDRLQKKDTYSVFSESVDPDELPDYHEIIKHPMDFGTVRRKLDTGLYSKLEELEADVFLICSNAMQYNSSDTIYFRQARSIQELAKRDFQNLRHEGDDGELKPKVVRRGRPPGSTTKHLKKPLGGSPADRVDPDQPSGATLVTGEDNTNGSNAYNLRRAPPMLYRFQSADASHHRTRNGENYSELLADWNDEFPAHILRADMKYGNKQFLLDETRRDTYKQFHPSSFSHEPSVLSDLSGDTKQLMPVGLHLEHGYARSLARFAANLGPVAWKIASKKLGTVLPPGLKFGPGFVGENDASPQPSFFSFDKQKSSHNFPYNTNPCRPAIPSTSAVSLIVAESRFQGKDNTVEVGRKLNSSSELDVPRSEPFSGRRPVFQRTNGFTGVFGYNFPSKMGQEEASRTSQIQGMVPRTDYVSTHSIHSEEPQRSDSLRTFHSGNLMSHNTGTNSGKTSLRALSPHPRQYTLPVQPDLNVGLQAPGSPSSGLMVGSPQQPELALQL